MSKIAFRSVDPPREGRVAPRPDPALRLPQIVGLQHELSRDLAKLKIMVIGVGSVGWRVALHWARLGISELWLVDPKRLKSESVLTHPVGPPLIGRPKALTAGRECKIISPSTSVRVFDGPVHDVPLLDMASVDLVIVATDNLGAEREVGQRCLHLGKPLVHAAVQGEFLLLQVRVFGNKDAAGPCPCCHLSPVELQALKANTRWSCEGLANANKRALSAPVTRSFSSLCSLSADFAIHQSLRHLLRLGESVQDTLLEFCALTNKAVTSPLTRSQSCVCDHLRFEIVAVPDTMHGPSNGVGSRLHACSLAQLAERAGFKEDIAYLTFRVGDQFQWVESALCSCSAPCDVNRFVQANGAVAQPCHVCRKPMKTKPFFTHETVPASLIAGALLRPLRDLGAADAAWVLVRNVAKGVLFVRSRNDGGGT